MDIYSTIVGFFQSGGVFMYPIVLVLALGLAIALERYIYLSHARASNHREWKKLLPLLQAGEYPQVARITAESRTAISHIFNYGLNRVRFVAPVGVAASDTLGVWGEELISRADAAVYAAKRAGRTRVELALATGATSPQAA